LVQFSIRFTIRPILIINNKLVKHSLSRIGLVKPIVSNFYFKIGCMAEPEIKGEMAYNGKAPAQLPGP
jgi:hypothetical protein